MGRHSAVDALHVVDPDDPSAGEAIQALITALRDPDPRVRATAAGVISTFKPAPKLAIPGLVEAATSDAGVPSPARLPLLQGWVDRRPAIHRS